MRTLAPALSSVPFRLLALLAVVAVAVPARADQGEEATPDKAAAPYFFVADGDPQKDRLPLKGTSADVNIAGVIAHVAVRQLFANDNEQALEAVYVFPASTRAAVHRMRMKIGGRVIEARIDRKKEARATYDQAKTEGKRAALLDQERANVFSMRVANIMPGDRIEVELDYSEMLVPERGVYEFVYPGVVGPRYAGGVDPKKDGWIATGHLDEGQPSPFAWDVRVHLEAGMPLQEVTSPSHEVEVTRASLDAADVRLRKPGAGNRDFVLRYRLVGDKIQTGLLLAPPGRDGEGFFALMMEPPRRPGPADVTAREYVFLLDVSGSMHGFPLDTAKGLMKELLGALRPGDRFNVVLFSGAFAVMSPEGSIPATRENLAAAMAAISKESGGGGTELLGGLRASFAIPPPAETLSRNVVVVTDGFVGAEAESFRLVREQLGKANTFSFGIGSSVNRALIEGLARAGFGEPCIVTKPDEATAEAARFRAYIDRPLLARIEVAFKGFDAYDVAPQRLPDLLAERPLVLFGKYRGRAAGAIEVTGVTGRGAFRRQIAVEPAAVKAGAEALRWLWARKQAEWLEDEIAMGGADESKETLAKIGLRYSLLTSETSFVAVDHVVANPTGQLDTAHQPLPLPEGVTKLALGSTVELSREIMPPGDPILTVVAPPDALIVTATFPFGLVKDLAFDPVLGRWQTRFLVPKNVRDGEHRVPVVIVHRNGRVETVVARYRIDSTEPDFEVTTERRPEGLLVKVVGAEALRRATVALVGDTRVRIELLAIGDERTFVGLLPLQAGRHHVRVVVADKARNEAEHVLGVEVR